MKQQVIVVGGGASGLTAAIVAARSGASVAIMEHTSKPGKKILSTGNGKCNLTNMKQFDEAYRSNYPEFINKARKKVTVNEILDFFQDLGLVLTDRNGYIYPYSGQATAVLDALLSELNYLGVEIITDCQVKQIKPDLTVITSSGKRKADAVILAAGSMAAPKTGSDGSGYELAKALGHKIIPPLPALVQLRCKETWYKQATGVRTEATVTLKVDGKVTASDRGELQFTDYGVSGIPVFQVSRFAVKGLKENKSVIIELDLLPTMDYTETIGLLTERRSRFAHRPAKEFLNGVINQKLIPILLKEAKIHSGNVTQITEDQIKALTDALKVLKTAVTSYNSFEQAQVCSGGIDTREVNPETMESSLIKGLYLAGEVMDVDGICGGYNLQWAWTSGILSGRYAGRGKR
jgi:predicted Rossmann fold flavoprotein